jgi:spore coat protein U-like protein
MKRHPMPHEPMQREPMQRDSLQPPTQPHSMERPPTSRLSLARLAAALLLLAVAGRAGAQVTCSVAVSPLNFGAYTGAAVQVTGTVDLVCSGPQGSRPAYSVSAAPGNSNTYAQRTLRRTALPADTLDYGLTIQLGAGNVPWGDGSAGTSAWTGRTAPINAGNPQRAASANITGTLSAGAVPSAGAYSDTILVTATWN